MSEKYTVEKNVMNRMDQDMDYTGIKHSALSNKSQQEVSVPSACIQP